MIERSAVYTEESTASCMEHQLQGEGGMFERKKTQQDKQIDHIHQQEILWILNISPPDFPALMSFILSLISHLLCFGSPLTHQLFVCTEAAAPHTPLPARLF